MIKKVPAKVSIVQIVCDTCGCEMGFTGETSSDGKNAYQCKDEKNIGCAFRLWSTERYPFTDIVVDPTKHENGESDGRQLLTEDCDGECDCGEGESCSDCKCIPAPEDK